MRREYEFKIEKLEAELDSYKRLYNSAIVTIKSCNSKLDDLEKMVKYQDTLMETYFCKSIDRDDVYFGFANDFEYKFTKETVPIFLEAQFNKYLIYGNKKEP